MCKQTRWATFRFPSFVGTECAVQEDHQKCMKQLEATKKMQNQCAVSKSFGATKGKLTFSTILCRQNARFSELKHANLCNKC